MKVLITRKIPEVGLSFLQNPEIEIDYRQGPPLTKAELIEAVQDVDALLCVIPDHIDKDIIDAGKNLKIISTYSIGFDHIDTKYAREKGIHVSNTPGNAAEAVAEHAVAMILALGKNILPADTYIRDNKYKYWDPNLFTGIQFSGKTAGIIGFGRIGQYLAKILKNGLNMNIVYHDNMAKEEAEQVLGAKRLEMDELLKTADVISLNCNLCEETFHLISEEHLSMMKPTAILINTSRGKVVDEVALTQALLNKKLGGAGLDVFENEPEVNQELVKLDNVILTPHTASATKESRDEMSVMACQNIVDVLIRKTQPKYICN